MELLLLGTQPPQVCLSAPCIMLAQLSFTATVSQEEVSGKHAMLPRSVEALAMMKVYG